MSFSEEWDWAGEIFVKIHSTEKFSEYTFLYWKNILEKNRAKKLMVTQKYTISFLNLLALTLCVTNKFKCNLQ